MWMNHVHIGVSDLERAVAFYRDVMGLEVNTIPAANMASVRLGSNLSLDLDPSLKAADDGPKPVIIGFVVESADEAYARLKGKDVALEGEPQDQYWGVRNFYFRDPDGYTIECAQPLVKAGGRGG